MRTTIVAGNWKMHKTMNEALSYVDQLTEKELPGKVEIVLCPPFLALPSMRERLRKTSIRLGAQNTHWETEGAYTGELSPSMLKSIPVDYVIIGHSERRKYFAETDEMIHQKLLAVFQQQLIPILCVGESLAERENGQTEKVISRQIRTAVQGINLTDIQNLIIAYEPIWAIGSGQASTPEAAAEVIAFIRSIIGDLTNSEVADRVRIQYGGSVQADNIASFLSKPDIDGALVGGASLDVTSFYQMILAVQNMGERR